jgi:phosphoribosylanthranilate isomerase
MMAVAAKICGLGDEISIGAAIAGGAAHIGFVFYRPSPRYVSPERAAALLTWAVVPKTVRKVGLFVDADDETIAVAIWRAKLDLLQFHGDESPERVAEARRRFRLPVMKAVKIAGPDDIAVAERYLKVANWLLFDAKPPADTVGALPGGNGLAFDWALLGGRQWPIPWMLSGGLDPFNVAEAVAVTGATVVDVSSGVESRPGIKDPAKIAAFLKAVRTL